jgi:hypothetical protein
MHAYRQLQHAMCGMLQAYCRHDVGSGMVLSGKQAAAVTRKRCSWDSQAL